jgi:hypothetical protein
MSVKIFRATIGPIENKEDQINEYEKELEGRGMQIDNVTTSAAIDGSIDEYGLYSIVHYGQKGDFSSLRSLCSADLVAESGILE